MKTKDDPIWIKSMKLYRAEGKILKALRHVPQDERAGILNLLWDKYVVHPDRKDVK